MRQCKHLGSLRVGTIDEHQRSQVISHRKAAKLIRIEMPAIVVEHHSTAHHKDSESIRLIDEMAQGIGPCRHLATLIHIEPNRPTDGVSSCHDRVPDVRGANERQWFFPYGSSKIVIPLLTLLADVNGVEQVWRRMRSVHISSSAKIRDRHALYRRFRQEKKTDGGMDCLGKSLDLIERRLLIAALPPIELRERSREVLHCSPSTLTSPAQQFRLLMVTWIIEIRFCMVLWCSLNSFNRYWAHISTNPVM